MDFWCALVLWDADSVYFFPPRENDTALSGQIEKRYVDGDEVLRQVFRFSG